MTLPKEALDERPEHHHRVRAPPSVHPAVGVHHPVRPDRADGDPDLGHPRGRVRARQGRGSDPRELLGDRGRPPAHPHRLPDRSDQRALRDRGREGEHQLLQRGHPVRRHRRRAVHHRHRRLPGRDDAHRRDPDRDQQARRAAPWTRTLADPSADGRVRPRRVDVRHGRGEPGLLHAGDSRHDHRRLRRADGGCDRPAGLWDRHAGLDHQPVRHRHRLGVRRHLDQRRPAVPADHPDRRAGRRDLLRDAVRRTGQARPDDVGGPSHEGGERGALQRAGRDGTRSS